jgi:hypothetical protein
MLESGATFAPDLGLDPTLELDIAGESLAFESSVPWALIDTVFGMICLDRCTKVRRPCITSKVDEDVFGLGGRKTRLVVDHTPLLGRVGGPNIWKRYVSVYMSHMGYWGTGGGLFDRPAM